MDDVSPPRIGVERALGLGGAVLDDDSFMELLQRVVLVAAITVGGAQAVSITVAGKRGYQTANSTGPIALAVDDAQYEQDEGPCLEAMRTGHQLNVGDSDLGRWPHFAQKARELAVNQVLSTPLLHPGHQSLGALNVYGTDGQGFGEADARTAAVLGELAAILVGSALALRDATQLSEQLREAVASREAIGTAKGILMERQGCTRDQAFDILRRASQRENRKLRELAEELVARVENRAVP